MSKDVKCSIPLALDPARRAGKGSLRICQDGRPRPPMLSPVPDVETVREAELCPDPHSSVPTPSPHLPKIPE